MAKPIRGVTDRSRTDKSKHVCTGLKIERNMPARYCDSFHEQYAYLGFGGPWVSAVSALVFISFGQFPVPLGYLNQGL